MNPMEESASCEGGIVQPREREVLAAAEGAARGGPADDKVSGWDTKITKTIGPCRCRTAHSSPSRRLGILRRVRSSSTQQ